jgi:hypothetical protein
MATTKILRTNSDPALAEHAAEIRRLSKQTMESIVEIGRRLSECRAILKKNGEWCAWLKDEFDWSDQTARRFIHVHDQLPELNKLLSREFPISALYLLAAPSTPDEARAEIIERAQAGEPLPVAEIKRTINTAKSRKQPAARRQTERKPEQQIDLEDAVAAASNGESAAVVEQRCQARVQEQERKRERERVRREREEWRSDISGFAYKLIRLDIEIARELHRVLAASGGDATQLMDDIAAGIEIEEAEEPLHRDDGLDIPPWLRRVAP